MVDTSRLHSLLEQGDGKARSGDPVGAVEVYNELLDLVPGYADALERKATALVTTGNFEAALACHNDLVRGEPRSAGRYAARARVLSYLQKYSDAIGDYDHAVALGGPDASLLKEKGLCLRRVERLDDAIDTYRIAISLNHDDSDLQVALGDALLDAGNIDEAIDSFNSACDGDEPRFTDVDWTTRGDRLLAADRNKDAAVMYRAALEVRPSTEAWRGLAEVYLATKQYDKAMQATESACALSAEDAVAWNLRGCVFFELGRLAEALEYFTIVTRLDPDEILGWSNMAVVLDNLERDKDAVTAIRRAIELSPEQVALWSQLSAYQLGSGQNEAVLESTSRCIQLDPTFTSALITRSLALRELGRLDEALECSDRALETDRSEAYCWICKAFTLAELGREKDAIATLDEALSAVRYPQDALRAKSNLLSDKFGRHTEALEPMKQAWQMAREDNVIASNYAEMLIISGHYADGRAIANEVAARESKPSRSCAMRFIIFVSYALPGDFSGYENALDSFISYYAHEFGKRDRTAIDWDYSGLISVVRSGAFSEGNKFVIETLTDLQRGRIQAKDVSYLSGKVDDSRGSSMS